MKRLGQQNSGYTLIEVLGSIVLLTLVMASAISSWLYLVRAERINSVQNELDVDARIAMERLKSDLRLSAVDKIFFYPEGVGPYTAMSFPKARDDDGDGVIEVDPYTNVIWDQTIVYHVWSSSPNQLRRTVFDPRNTTLTAAQRQSQLNSVVINGNGASTYNAAAARTSPVFQNLFTWRIKSKGPQYDAYSSVLGRDLNAVLGSILLTPGSHVFKFRVTGKNTLSSGYKIGLDKLAVSPSGIQREAEAQTVTSQSGASAANELMTLGSWSGNYQLGFPATAAGNFFTLTMDNDRWEETNFDDSQAQSDDILNMFDQGLTPKDFIIYLTPPTNVWMVDWQTLDVFGGTSTTGSVLRACAVRVPLRGAMMMDGGALKYSGKFHCMYFYASASSRLRILGAYLSEAADQENFSPDATNTGVALTFPGYGSSVDIDAGSYGRAELPSGSTFYFDKDRTYFVTYLVADNAGKSDAKYWREYHTGGTNPPPPACYVLPAAASPTLADCQAAVWSTKTNLVVTNVLYALEHVHCLAASNGTWTSQITDTHLAAPSYSDIAWNAVKPSGTALRMKIRTGNNEYMTDAPAWTSVTAMTSAGPISPPSRRYVQVRCEMDSSSDGWSVPYLKDFTVKWTGESKVVDIGGTMTTGPGYGIYEILVDDKQLVKGITIDLTIFQDVVGFRGIGSNRMTSTISGEVEPRNTGR